jgi:hypothetical protein
MGAPFLKAGLAMERAMTTSVDWIVFGVQADKARRRTMNHLLMPRL